MIEARSPYIVTINETLQEGSKLELFIWKDGDTEPTAPAYTFSKKIPSTNNTATFYNISPYLREYITFNQTSPYSDTNNIMADNSTYCKVKYVTYYLIGDSYIELDTVETFAFDGYGYFQDSYNPTEETLGNFFLSVKGNNDAYYYPCSDGLNSITNAGTLTLLYKPNIYAVYTNLNDLTQTTVTISNDHVINLLRVLIDNYADGNKLQIFEETEAGDTLLATYYFVPKCECKYEPVTVDFINRFGAWQREFFYKASNETISIENTEYNLMQSVFPEYNEWDGQRKTFNTNGKRTIKVNSDWVEESFKDTIQELMLSEVIRVNGLPANLNTKSIEKFKQINQKTINYSLEFTYAFDIINSVN